METYWIWSQEYQDYYHIGYRDNGQRLVVWASQQAAHVSEDRMNTCNDQTPSTDEGDTIVTTQIARTSHVKASVNDAGIQPSPTASNFSNEAVQEGRNESLDNTYQTRSGREAHDFFKIGRVFAMLYTEPADNYAFIKPGNDANTSVQFGESAFTQVRRFVVVSVRRGFVLACAISTYGNKATLKPGCNPGEHAVMYNAGTSPSLLSGEKERGLYKDPIEVKPNSNDAGSTLSPLSRVRFGKVYSIEWNIKVKDLGRVADHHLSRLTAHYQEEEGKLDQSPEQDW